MSIKTFKIWKNREYLFKVKLKKKERKTIICVLWGSLLVFDVLLDTKSEQKLIGNWFWAPIIFKKSGINNEQAFQ